MSAQIDSLGRLIINPSPTQIGTHTFTLVARQGNLFTTRDVTVNVIPDPITDTRVSGTIKGTDGAVLAGVTVGVGNTTTTTNALGEFTLTLPTGSTAKTLKITEQLTDTGISHSGFSPELNTLLGHNLYKTIKTTTGGVLGDGIYTYLPEPAAVVADKDNLFARATTQLVVPVSVPINSQANLIDGSVTDSLWLLVFILQPCSYQLSTNSPSIIYKQVW